MQIDYGETTLPILREADIAVVGGSLAGIAAALTLAGHGKSVVLIEPRTYLGRELTATLRPWLTLDAGNDPGGLPGPIRTILAAHEGPSYRVAGEIALHPDAIKRSLEDALLAGRVDLLYASLPVGLCPGGFIVGNKSGRQIIRCDTIIDTSETALLARLAGGAFEPSPGGPVRFARTLEFDRVDLIAASTHPVPDHLQIAGNTLRLHTGYQGPGHLLVKFDLDVPYAADQESATHVEFEARRRSIGLVAFLVSQHPAFAKARFAGGSHELHGQWTPSLSGAPPEWSTALGDAFVPRRTAASAACRSRGSPVLCRVSGVSVKPPDWTPGSVPGSSIRSVGRDWASISPTPWSRFTAIGPR